jgi:hypothetical protein
LQSLYILMANLRLFSSAIFMAISKIRKMGAKGK